MTRFIEKIYYLLEYNGISQAKFLTKLRLGKNSINYWENRDTMPNGKTLIKIADYFDISIDYLVGRTDDPILHKKSEKQD